MRLTRGGFWMLGPWAATLAFSGWAAACVVDLDIDGCTEVTEDTAGAIVARRYDDNEAPRRKITLQQPTGYEGSVTLTRTTPAKVKVFDAATGGTEITFNGTDNQFAKAALPKDLFVQGDVTSTGIKDVTLTLTMDSPPGLSDSVVFTVIETYLMIYNERNGPVLSESSEVTPGSFVLVNRDDDDSAGGQDNSNATIDGETDKLDMAKMGLHVTPSSVTGITVQLNAPEADRAHVRVFNESGSAVTTWPDPIPLSRFASGPLYYYIEGLTDGSATLTLTIKQGTIIVYADDVKVTVKPYHEPSNDWGAWPGGQADTSLNPTETITSANLGLSGNVKWAIDHGGTAATIVSHTPTTGDKWNTVVVRYDTTSGDATFTKAAEIKAYDTGADSKIAGVRRTVFRISYNPVNVNGNLDGDNTRRFPPGCGNNAKAEVVTPGGAITWFCAKVEGIGTVSPTGISWSSRGVVFVYSDPAENPPAPAKWQFCMRREKQFTLALQKNGWGTPAEQNYRYWATGAWGNDGDSDHLDAQYPTDAKPNKFFRIDAPGSPQSPYKQMNIRADVRDFVEWRNSVGWTRCSPYAEWWCDLTGAYPGCTVVAPNTSGTGSSTQAASNTRPAIDAGQDQTVSKNDNVTLTATSTDGDGNSSAVKDGDNDILVDGAWNWTQTGGPAVTLSNNGIGRTVTFTAPNVQQQTLLTFQVTVEDGTQTITPVKFRPTNHTSNPDTVQVTVNP
jgi:hypothetical protein